MKTQILSLILAIAMLLCGCQAAPAQSSSAAPIAPANEEQQALVVEQVMTEQQYEAEKPAVPQVLETAEKVTETVEEKTGNKTLSAEYITKNRKENICLIKDIAVFRVEDYVYALPKDSSVGYLLGNYNDGTCIVKAIDDDRLIYYAGSECVFYDISTFEKLDLTINFKTKPLYGYNNVKIGYDKQLKQYAFIYATIKNSENHIEINRFNSNGEFIDVWHIDDLPNSHWISFYNRDIGYKNGELSFLCSMDDGLSFWGDFYVEFNFNTGEANIFENISVNGYYTDWISIECTDIVEDKDAGIKTVYLYSVYSYKGEKYTADASLVVDAEIDDYLLKIRTSGFDGSYSDKRRTAKGYFTNFNLDYNSGLGTGTYIFSCDLLDGYGDVYKNIADRYDVYVIDDNYKSYVVTVDNAADKAWFIGSFFYGGCANGEELIYSGEDAIYGIPVTGGAPRIIIDCKKAEQLANEKLGLQGASYGAFDYDEELGLIVLTMYDDMRSYWPPDVLYKDEDILKYAKGHNPNYFLAVYDHNGNFIKHLLTEDSVEINGKHGAIIHYGTEVNNGIATYVEDNRKVSINYIEEQPQYSVYGNKAYWRPVEQQYRNILCWYDFEKETVGEMIVPNEWGELMDIRDGNLIFRNADTATCYKSDIEGNLLDYFFCEDVVGMHKSKWYPLSDFSGIIFSTKSVFYGQDYFWSKETGKAEIYYMYKTSMYNKEIVSKYPQEFVMSRNGRWFKEGGTSDGNEMYTRWISDSNGNRYIHIYGEKRGYNAIYCPVIGKLAELKGYYTKASGNIQFFRDPVEDIEGGKFVFTDDMIIGFSYEYGRSDYYYNIDIATGDTKCVDAALPTGYDDLRIVTVTDSGKVIIALQFDGEWQIYSQNAKIA